MRPSPEEAFDRWFRTLGFRGRDTLQDLPESLQEQLRALQTMYNEAFERERTFPEYTRTLPLYFDYIDADVENAIATTDDEHFAFIGITRQLVFKISDLCILLARADSPICRAITVQPSPEPYNALQGTLVYILLSFIVAHEWSHHKHGHLTQFSSPGKIFQEVLNTAPVGSMDDQIKEIAADGYAAFLILAHLFDDRRGTFLPFLTFNPAPPHDALEQVFLTFLIVAFSGFMMQLPACNLDGTTVQRLTHPPAQARLNCFMREVAAWCSHNRRELDKWIVGHFQTLLNATTEAIYGVPNFRHVWADQFHFLHSPQGQQYDKKLTEGINAYKKTWGENTQQKQLLEPAVELQLQLVPATNDPEFETALSQLSQGLRDANISFANRSIAWGALPNAGVTGIFLLFASTLGPTALIQLRKLLQTYLAHGGRRIKLKNHSVSIECSPEDFQKLFTPEQIQQLLQPPTQKAVPPKKKAKEETA
jgi:hypothetical protein